MTSLWHLTSASVWDGFSRVNLSGNT